MSFDDRLLHTLVVKRLAPILDGSGDPVLDDYGQPTSAPTTFDTVPGLIQPRTAREIALASQGGAVIGKFVGYIRPLAGLSTHDWIEITAPASMAGRFDILDIDAAAGLEHHFELSLQAVT
jgi:hypothetical protein